MKNTIIYKGQLHHARQGSLEGTITSSVVFEGDLIMAADLTVKGDLHVTGDLINNGGYALTVEGSLRANSINFTHAIDFNPQGNVYIAGDLILLADSEFRVNPSRFPTLTVNGDMIADAAGVAFNGSGKPGAHGLTIHVLGAITGFVFDLSGGDASDSAGAGEGGTLKAQGGGLFGITANGGSTNYLGYPAANGGRVILDGIGYMYYYPGIVMNGGTANVSGQDGGHGGHVTVSNLMAISFDNDVIVMNGGNSLDGVGGEGGIFEFSGMWNSGTARLNGGNGAVGGVGGVIQGGGVNAQSFYANGGNGTTTGGNGGQALFAGTASLYGDLHVNGGTGTTPGDGGTIEVFGMLFANSNNIQVDGGTPGTISISSGVVASSGTAAAPSYSFVNAPGYGMWQGDHPDAPGYPALLFSASGYHMLWLNPTDNIIGPARNDIYIAPYEPDQSGIGMRDAGTLSVSPFQYGFFGTGGLFVGRNYSGDLASSPYANNIFAVMPETISSGVGLNITLQAQSVGDGIGGDILLTAGEGTDRNGLHKFLIGANLKASIGDNGLSLYGDSGATYTRFFNTATGDTAGDGLLVGIDSTGVAFIEQQEASELRIRNTGSQNIQLEANSTVFQTPTATGSVEITAYTNDADTVFMYMYSVANNPSYGLRLGVDDTGAAFVSQEDDLPMYVQSTGNLFVAGDNVVVGADLATSATDGFLYIASGAGTPTGVPTSFTGCVPLYYDRTNDILYVYNGGWKSVALT